MIVFEEQNSKTLTEASVSKYYSWAEKPIIDSVKTISHNMPDFGIDNIPQPIIADMFMGIANGGQRAAIELATDLSHQKTMGKRSDFDNNFNHFMTEIEQVFFVANTTLRKIRSKYKV